MYLRFVIEKNDEESGRKKGLFIAMDELIQDSTLYDYEIKMPEDIYEWFKKNLRVPRVQSAQSNKYRKPMAISWFKSSATDHIEKMRQYAQILIEHGVLVTQVTSERPGKIVYEDQYQVAAIPFSDTFT